MRDLVAPSRKLRTNIISYGLYSRIERHSRDEQRDADLMFVSMLVMDEDVRRDVWCFKAPMEQFYKYLDKGLKIHDVCQIECPRDMEAANFFFAECQRVNPNRIYVRDEIDWLVDHSDKTLIIRVMKYYEVKP